MQIAQVLAGYTLGGADLLRRAMGKKKPEEMAKQRSIFVDGAVARGVAAQTAAHIFDLMEKFAGYGFNKSHSAAYARAVVPDRVAEDALPGGVHGGGAVVRHGQDRQGRDADRRVQPHGAQGRAAGRQRLAVHVHGVGAAGDPLRPRRDQGRRPGGGREHAARARGQRRLPRPARPVPPARPQQGQPAGARGADPLRRHRLDGRPAAPRDADAPAAGGHAGGRPVDPREGGRPDRPVRPDLLHLSRASGRGRAQRGEARRLRATRCPNRRRRCRSGARRCA